MTSLFQYDAPTNYDAAQQYDAYTAPLTSSSTPPVIPHLSAALALNPDGSFIWQQQGLISEVAQSVEMIVGTPRGQRTMVPTFGVPDPTFTYPVNKGDIQHAIAQFETRATANVNITYAPNGIANVTVNVGLVRGSTL